MWLCGAEVNLQTIRCGCVLSIFRFDIGSCSLWSRCLGANVATRNSSRQRGERSEGRRYAEGSLSMNVRSRGARDFEQEKENSDSDLPITYHWQSLDLRVLSCFGVFRQLCFFSLVVAIESGCICAGCAGGWVRHKELEIEEFPSDPGIVKLTSQWERPEVHCWKPLLKEDTDPAQARGKDIAKHGGWCSVPGGEYYVPDAPQECLMHGGLRVPRKIKYDWLFGQWTHAQVINWVPLLAEVYFKMVSSAPRLWALWRKGTSSSNHYRGERKCLRNSLIETMGRKRERDILRRPRLAEYFQLEACQSLWKIVFGRRCLLDVPSFASCLKGESRKEICVGVGLLHAIVSIVEFVRWQSSANGGCTEDADVECVDLSDVAGADATRLGQIWAPSLVVGVVGLNSCNILIHFVTSYNIL